MAFILLFLHKSEAYSFDDCQIVVLHVQSKQRKSKAAMQALHDVWQNFVIFISWFRRALRNLSVLCRSASDSASVECGFGLSPAI
jgi:hypothetical protein